MMAQDQDTATAEPFGAWLLKQGDRRGWIADLAKAATADRTFPKQGGVEQVGAWLDKKMASGDDWEALEDAQRAWEAGQ
jgi:hypothetical protein